MKINLTQLSKTISHALRHEPEKYGLELDAEGWVPLEKLLNSLRRMNPDWANVDEIHIQESLGKADKKRFEMENGKIRAFYGHSTEEKIQKKCAEPPEFLFHGTPLKNRELILMGGLKPMGRQYVHLSGDLETAKRVAKRYSAEVVIFKISAVEAQRKGILFYMEPGGIWLADFVPPQFIFEN